MKSLTRRGILSLLLLLLTLPCVFAAETAETTEEWSFGIIPDTQWNPRTPPYYGVAVHVIDAVNKEMIRQKVDFVIQVGDLVDNPTRAAYKTRAEWNRPMVEDAGIRFYPVRGNHDSTLPAVGWIKHFFPDLPGTENGGGSSPDLPGAQGLTYSFTHKGGKFLLLDTFLSDNGTPEGIDYTIRDLQPWIDRELQADDHRFAMVFSHKNLLGQGHKDNVFTYDRSNQDDPEDVQNAFYASLHDNGVKYYISGHDHMYHRSTIKSPDGKSEVTQIIAGSASHKFYVPAQPLMSRETSHIKDLNRIGFIIVRVTGEGFEAKYYSAEPFGSRPAEPEWEVRDTFGYEFER